MHEPRRVTWFCAPFRYSRRSESVKSRNCAKIVEFISMENWHALRAFLRTEDGVAAVNNSMHKSDQRVKQNVLHYACQFHPPLDVTKMLVELFPDTLSFEDNDDRTPLHVAAAFGASPQVIDYLIEQDKSAALKQDSNGRGPLHLSCQCCILERRCDSGCKQGTIKGPLVNVIKSLYAAAPATVNMEDYAGISPIEYAIIHGADRKVVRMLQKFSEKEWKMMKKSEQDSVRESFITSSISKKSFFDVQTNKFHSKQSCKHISKQLRMLREIRQCSYRHNEGTWIPPINPLRVTQKRSSFASEAA